jgi:2-phosphosulfolactate phosphatase
MQLDVYFLPTETTPEDVAHRTVVVIDVLRATTTILFALDAGAREVIPCLEVEDAKKMAERFGETVVLGGEREGKPIPGFTFGNSPSEYTRQSVGGRTLIFTTTNGTRAMQACRKASRVLIGAFVNLSRVVAALEHTDRAALLCAGTNGRVTREDVLFAGAVIRALRDKRVAFDRLNDEAELAIAAWDATVDDFKASDQLLDALSASRGGRNLIELDYKSDIILAAQINSHPVLGELRLAEWRIVIRSDPR